MIIVSCDRIPGKKITKTLGFVRGSTTRARHLGNDIFASLRTLVGGEIHEYSKLMGEAREQALDRMRTEAKSMGANAVVAVRFASSEIAKGAAEILVYGTAVVTEEEEGKPEPD